MLIAQLADKIGQLGVLELVRVIVAFGLHVLLATQRIFNIRQFFWAHESPPVLGMRARVRYYAARGKKQSVRGPFIARKIENLQKQAKNGEFKVNWAYS